MHPNEQTYIGEPSWSHNASKCCSCSVRYFTLTKHKVTKNH